MEAGQVAALSLGHVGVPPATGIARHPLVVVLDVGLSRLKDLTVGRTCNLEVPGKVMQQADPRVTAEPAAMADGDTSRDRVQAAVEHAKRPDFRYLLLVTVIVDTVAVILAALQAALLYGDPWKKVLVPGTVCIDVKGRFARGHVTHDVATWRR